jgi:hypothetical protein
MPWDQILPFLKYGAIGVATIALVFALGWNVQIARSATELAVEKIEALRRTAREVFLFAGACLLLALGAQVADGWRRTYTVQLDLVPSDFIERAAETPSLRDIKQPIRIKLAGSQLAAEFVAGNAQLKIVDGSAVSVDVNALYRVFERNEALTEAIKRVTTGQAGLTEEPTL